MELDWKARPEAREKETQQGQTPSSGVEIVVIRRVSRGSTHKHPRLRSQQVPNQNGIMNPKRGRGL